ncbi:MAG: tetratricopeptide repeat protein, partial [Verrucomicrobiota bacterium]|nr:tetratricopeptide repeat protein [Verrucomicrobiota bacterium]
MKPLQTFAALLIASVLLASSASAQQSDGFAKGNEEYAAGKFREAIELYDGVVRDGQLSAALFYNLGNAWYRAEDLGRAILNYERALALQPRHPEALANLRLVRDKARALELRQTSAERLFAH